MNNKREILFKAKNMVNGEWVEGFYFETHYGDKSHIVTNDFAFYEVDASTVCQFTGLHDKNGCKIFDGDIVEYNENDIVERSFVYWNEYKWCREVINEDFDPIDMENEDFDSHHKIIGNIHNS